MLKHILLVLLLTFAFTGCGETTTTSTTVVQGENGTYINNSDGTVTYIQHIEDGDATDGTTGEYNASDDAEECRSKGYFYCNITKTCNDVSASSGSCTR